MTRKFAEWASEHGPITKIRPSDGCGKKFFSTAVGSVHHRIRFEDYLGNVDLVASNRLPDYARHCPTLTFI